MLGGQAPGRWHVGRIGLGWSPALPLPSQGQLCHQVWNDPKSVSEPLSPLSLGVEAFTPLLPLQGTCFPHLTQPCRGAEMEAISLFLRRGK